MFESSIREDLCGNCGKPKRQLRRMSLTQWMFSSDACNCQAAASLDYNKHRPREFSSVMELCESCGLPVLTGRIGSMTQWIFGANSCKCAAQSLKDTGATQLDARGSETVQPLFSSQDMSDIEAAVPQFRVADEVTALTMELGLPADRYQAIKLVGQGAISKVFECQDRLLQRVVAIKFLIAAKWTGEEILRFQTEAKATSRLSHPNIITVHDFGSTRGGQPYMVMEYFTGVSLHDLIDNKGPLPEDVAAEIGAQVAAGMEFAHNKGILHRDIKPANIMLIETGEGSVVAKVIDFGIADLNADQCLSVNGQSVLGTPNYMSPDQVQGRIADGRSDVYSLGCTLFEAMTGRPPFVAETALEIVTMHAHRSAPGLKEAYPEGSFSDEMEALIERSLQKEPDKRFSSMEEMRQALEGIFTGGPAVENEEVATAYDTRSGTNNTNGVRAAALAGATLLLVAAVFFLTKLLAPGKGPVASTPALPKADELHYTTPLASLDIQENLQGNDVLKPYLKLKTATSIVIRGSSITDKGLDYIMHLPLESVGLEGSRITDKGLEKICSIKTLKKLNLSHSPQLRAYQHLASCPQLETLFLLSNELLDEDFKYFEPLTNLRTLNVSENPGLTGTGFVYLKDLKHLKELRASSLQLTKNGINTLSKLKRIQNLSLRYCNITDKDLDSIVKMQKLTILNLTGTKITDKGVLKLLALPNLNHLDLGTCPNLTRQGLVDLQRRRWKLEINMQGPYEL